MKLRYVTRNSELVVQPWPEPGDLALLRRQFTQRDERGDPLPCSHEGLVAALYQRDLRRLS